MTCEIIMFKLLFLVRKLGRFTREILSCLFFFFLRGIHYGVDVEVLDFLSYNVMGLIVATR